AVVTVSSSTKDSKDERAAVFMLNRDLESSREITLDWQDPTPKRVVACETLHGSDLKAVNTFEKPKTVVPQSLEAPKVGSKMTFKLVSASSSCWQVALS